MGIPYIIYIKILKTITYKNHYSYCLIFNKLTYILQKQKEKDNKLFNRKRDEVYFNYLKEVKLELGILKIEELEARNYNNPDYEHIYNMVMDNSERLYERKFDDEDFLNVRVGTSTVEPSYQLKGKIDRLGIEKNELELEMEDLYNEYSEIKNSPYVLDLNKSNIGLVGKHEIVNKEIHKMIDIITFNHSYMDVRFVFIIRESDLNEFKEYRFLKHSKHLVTGQNSIIYNEDSRDKSLNSLTSLFRAREEGDVLPNIIFVVTNFDLLNNHPILEFILKEKDMVLVLFKVLNE